MKNEFLNDAQLFLHDAAARVVEGLDADSMPAAIMQAALGIERILKGILFSINPLYVYKNQDFKNTVPIVYANRLVKDAASVEVSKKPDRDVYSFRAALTRCCAISETSTKHTSLLYRLASQRDVVAHCVLSDLKTEVCSQLLNRDFFPLLVDYATELSIPTAKLIGPKEFALQRIAVEHQDELGDRIRMKLDLQHKKWDQLKKTPNYVASMTEKTRSHVQQIESEKDRAATIVNCPSCKNDSIILLAPEYQLVDGESEFVGLFATGLRCMFCKLQLDEYDEMDHLEIQRLAIDSMTQG